MRISIIAIASMITLYRQIGSSTTGLATASAIFVGLLLYTHYYAFNSVQTIDSEQAVGSSYEGESESMQNTAMTGNKQSTSAIGNTKPGSQVDPEDSISAALSQDIDPELEQPMQGAAINQPEKSAVKTQLSSQLSHHDHNAATLSRSNLAMDSVPTQANGASDSRIHADDVTALQHYNRLGGYSTNRVNYRGNHQSNGRGKGRSQGRGDGEFTFNMSFKSRSRMHADIDADTDLNADQRSYQASGMYQAQGVHPAYRYYYYGY